jgi:hypothetical protein
MHPRAAYLSRQDEIRIDRRQAGQGYRHVVSVADVRAFVGLLPDWDDVAVGLRSIVIDRGASFAIGWYSPGTVALCAWQSGLWGETTAGWIADNESLLGLLDVAVEKRDGSHFILWTERQARAFMLLDVLPHELGHHRDLMTTMDYEDALADEPYADEYAREVRDLVWPAYTRHFEL